MTSKSKIKKNEINPQKEGLKKLSKKIKEIEKEKHEYLTLAQRCKADFLNYKREEGERTKELVDFEKQGWALELLSILDYFGRAKEGIAEKDKGSPVLQGFFQIEKYFEDFLRNEGIEELETQKGVKFDPNFHEVVEVEKEAEKEAEKEEGIILKIIQKGYKFNNKLIRPTKVRVSGKNKPAINN